VVFDPALDFLELIYRSGEMLNTSYRGVGKRVSSLIRGLFNDADYLLEY
jgi:hypothetical protein